MQLCAVSVDWRALVCESVVVLRDSPFPPAYLLSRFISLREISLEHSHAWHIGGEDISALVNLRSLYLDHTLCDVNAISSLTNLTTLSLDNNNELTNESLGQLTNLTSLCLGACNDSITSVN